MLCLGVMLRVSSAGGCTQADLGFVSAYFLQKLKRRLEKDANQLFSELPGIFSQCETLRHVGRKRRCEYSNEFS